VSKDWDIARPRRNTKKRSGSWTLLSLSVNASMKRDQLSPKNQAEVYLGEWPPNSPDLNRLYYHVWGAMLEHYKTFQPKPSTIDELKKVLQTIWDDLPQNSINKIILSFVRSLQACVKAGSRHFELGSFLWTRVQTFFAGFWTVSKLWQSEISNFHVSVWFQYKHYEKIVIFIVIVLHGSVVI